MRKTSWLSGFILASALLCARPALAAPIFYSGDGGDILHTAGAVTVINSPAVFGDVSHYVGLANGAVKWISYANTGEVGGPGWFYPSNVPCPVGDVCADADASLHLSRQFTISAPGTFTLWALADDTATIRLARNGGGFSDQPFTAANFPGASCSEAGHGIVGCLDPSTLGFYSTFLSLPGTYTFDLYGFQLAGYDLGAQYAADFSAVPVPEPVSIWLLSTGLGVLATRARKRRV